MDHKEHIEQVARIAAAIYGQDWKAIDTGVRDRWIETVRHTTRGGGENQMEKIAGQAIDEWYKRQEVKPEPVAEPELKPKKRGK